MKKFKAIAEKADVLDLNGTIVTKRMLADLVREFKKPIILTLDFNDEWPIGIIQKVEFDGENLIVQGEFIKEGEFQGYIVPSYIVEKDEWKEDSKELKRTIKKVRLINFGLTANPINPMLPKFEFI